MEVAARQELSFLAQALERERGIFDELQAGKVAEAAELTLRARRLEAREAELLINNKHSCEREVRNTLVTPLQHPRNTLVTLL
jgi:hypothetical protein